MSGQATGAQATLAGVLRAVADLLDEVTPGLPPGHREDVALYHLPANAQADAFKRLRAVPGAELIRPGERETGSTLATIVITVAGTPCRFSFFAWRVGAAHKSTRTVEVEDWVFPGDEDTTGAGQ
jgi:hypothetical protein